jgi:adenosylmethionine-8-amino-7-oxononanoate aminotransferase
LRRRHIAYRSQSPGDPQRLMRECLSALEAILREHASRIAAICIEPIVQGPQG